MKAEDRVREGRVKATAAVKAEGGNGRVKLDRGSKLQQLLTTWKAKLPLAPAGDSDSWLQATFGGPGLCELRCKACSKVVAQIKNNNASHTWYLLRQHRESNKHSRNVSVYLGLAVDDVGRPICVGSCPDVEDFRNAWKALIDGKLVKRCNARAWSLVECIDGAVQEITKEGLVNAESISIMRDERKQRLLVRFSSCSSDLVVSTGVLGLARGFGTGHINITDSTENLFVRACGGNPGVAKSVMQKVQLLVVDAASDEILAGERSRGQSGDAAVVAIMPNLKIIARDAAHASRRFLTRLWKCDDDIAVTLEHVIHGKHSITQRIDHSDVFRQWFEEEVRKDGGTVHNLHAAKHRFESYATPLSRLAEHFPAIIRTAMRIARDRHGKSEGKDAAAFLQSITPLLALKLAMLADAAHEVLHFTRICDSEELDTAALYSHLGNLLERCEMLFGDNGGCLKIPECFSARMTQRLAARLHFSCNAEARSLMGPNAEDALDCLTVMGRWVGMLREAASAEFPEFTVFNAFGIFNLAAKAPTAPAGENQVATDRLAQVFGVPAEALRAELARWRPLAQLSLRDYGCSNKEAWQRALQCHVGRRQKPSQRSVDRPDALITVLLRYLAWSASTSRIEQTFSTCQRLMGHRGSADVPYEEMLVRLAAARSDVASEVAKTLARAQALWSAQTDRRDNPARAVRADKGLKRKTGVATSEATALAKRRQAIISAHAASSAPAATEPLGREDLSEKMAKELTFQHAKQEKRKLEALRDGILLPGEVDEPLQEALAQMLADTEQRAKVRAAELRRTARLAHQAELDWTVLQGRWVHIALDGDTAGVATACQRQGLRIALDPALADLFVVEDPSNPSKTIRLLSGAKGLLVMSAKRALSGDSGAFLQFERALRLQRVLWATDAFQARHGCLWNHIVTLATLRGCKWKIAASRDAIVARGCRPVSKSECVVLGDAAGDHVAGTTVMNIDEFLKHIFVVRCEASRLR